jgi:serine protease Do
MKQFLSATCMALSLATTLTFAPPSYAAQAMDVADLVEQTGSTVVNISTTKMIKSVAQDGPDQQSQDLFRHFFPGMPMPGPGQGQGRMPGREAPSRAEGSGFIVSADGYILTNAHVVDGADEVTVKLTDKRTYIAKVIGSDKRTDVALIKITAGKLPVVKLGNPDKLRVGEAVAAIGSPFGFENSVTAGIVSAKGRSLPDDTYVPFIQTDVPINPGNSGGPLFNMRGEVVGINSQIFSNSGGYMGVSFAIPIDVAMSAVKQLKATGKVSRGQIGVNVQQIGTDDARGLGLPDTRGALIVNIAPGSAAEKAGLEPGDVIRSFNGAAINDSSELPPLVGTLPPGSRAKLTVLREGKPRDFDITLTQLDEGVANAMPGPGKRSPAAAGASNALGLVGQALDPNDRKQLGLKPGEGVGIARVEGLAARNAGLQPGDVVLSIGRTPVASPAALDRELERVKAGQTVMLRVRRGNATQFVAVTPRMDARQ